MNKFKTVCAIIINRNNEVLLTKRARDPFKGYWAIPSGIGESKKGINPEIAVKEEVRCDLGTNSFQGKYFFSLPIKDDEITDEAIIFVGYINENELNPDPRYSQGYKWVSKSDLKSLDNLAFDHSTIIKEYIKKNKS